MGAPKLEQSPILFLDKPVKYVNEVFTQPILILHPEVELINCISDFSSWAYEEDDWAVTIRTPNYKLYGHTCKNVGVGIIDDAKNVTIEKCNVSFYKEDAIRFVKDGARILRNTITNYSGTAGSHHKDAIQWWSGDQRENFSSGSLNKPIDEGRKRVLRDCHIIGNRIIDTGMVQGIFGSDGLIADFVIKDNYLDLPNSNHSISAWGMHEGVSIIENNDISRCLTPIRLHRTKTGQDPRRTGGNLRVILKDNTLSKTGRYPHIDTEIEPNLEAPVSGGIVPAPTEPDTTPIIIPPQEITNPDEEMIDLLSRVHQLEIKMKRASEALGNFQF